MEEKVNAIIAILKDRYGDAPCALHYAKDYELMIAVRLSAQCTDARVNLITPALFAEYPTLEALAGADISRVEELTPVIWALAQGKGSDLGTGGMVTKLKAAAMAMENRMDMVIANGADPRILYDIAEGAPAGTRFVGRSEKQ